MNRRIPLPAELRSGSHLVKEFLDAGVPYGRLRSKNLGRPAYGVVLPGEAGLDGGAIGGRCRALLPVLKPGQFFSRRTAALLWGIPVPDPPGGRIEVGSFHPVRAPRRPEVLGHRVREERVRRVSIDGLVTPSVPDIWCLLATVLDHDELVVAGDHLLTPRRLFDGSGRRLEPLATLDDLTSAVRRHRGGLGAPLRELALPSLRWPVDSPPETLIRLTIVRAGLPEPLVDCPVPIRERVLHADLGYPELKIGVEYEGRYHFIGGEDQARWDVERWEAMSAAGWRVLRVTAHDLRDPRGFLQRLRAAYEEASSRISGQSLRV